MRFTCTWNSSCPNEGNKEDEDLEPLSATEMGSTRSQTESLGHSWRDEDAIPYKQSTPWELISKKTLELQSVKIN